MILDSGVCTVFRKTDTSAPGAMPGAGYVPIWASWFADLNFETAPVWNTEGRKELRVDRRIRILQCKNIAQNDVVVMDHIGEYSERALDAVVYKVIRAYHGTDDEGPTQISDLSLEVITP